MPITSVVDADFDPLERRMQHSLNSSVMHFAHAGTRIHLLDTPGGADFHRQPLGGFAQKLGSRRLRRLSWLRRRGFASPKEFCFHGGYAARSAFGPKPRAQPEPRAQPSLLVRGNGEAEPHRTSGGKAVTLQSMAFCAKRSRNLKTLQVFATFAQCTCHTYDATC